MQSVIDGILTNYEVFGADNKQSFVILHGWGRSSQDWLVAGRFLGQRYKVYLLDLPGFGGSSVPEKEIFGTYQYADFVEEFLKKLEIKSPLLLGHSLGGRIGIILGTRPGLLKELILVDAAGIEEKSILTWIKIEISKIAKVALPASLVRDFGVRFGSEDYKAASSLKSIFKKVVSENLRSLLPKIMCPTLIIWGEKDRVQSIKLAKIMRNEIPRSKLRVVWEAGHNPQLEKPKDFQEILREELF